MRKFVIFGFLGVFVVASMLMMMSTEISDEELLRQAFDVKINRNRFFSEIDPITGVDEVSGTFYNNRLKMIFPVVNELGNKYETVETSSFAKKRKKDNKVYWHTGVDISYINTKKEPDDLVYIVSASEGVVDSITYSQQGGYGTNVKIRNTEAGITFVYAHLAEGSIPDEVKVGTVIKAGDKLGVMGTTGRSSGVHLHFGAFADGVTAEESDANVYGCISPFDEYYFVYLDKTVPSSFKPSGYKVHTYTE